jgi:3-oxoacyl-[acyl-carrier protein] reductase
MRMTDERRVAVVLAASKGLGRACAEVLAARGWDLVVCSRTSDGVRDTVEALTASGVRAEGVEADVSRTEDIERVFARADEAFGRVDALVCNAGGPPPGDFLSLDDDAWARGYELTLMSAVRALRAAIPRMRAGGYGRLVVLGSSSVRRPIPNLVLSNAYRPAIAGLMKSLAVELGPDGITANMVSPGRIETERLRQLDQKNAEKRGVAADEVRNASIASIPMGRYGAPEELAEAVAFLVSEQAGYITGQSLLVDGGLVPTIP